MKLIKPTVELMKAYIEFIHEFHAAGEEHVHGVGGIDIDNFEESVCKELGYAKGIGLPENCVPSNTYWFLSQGGIIGTCNLRHQLNDFLKSYGGHVGYSIRPSQRGEGYGTQILRLALEKARTLGIGRVLITCDDDNIASVRVIEKNSGKLADKVNTENSKILTRRYWIDFS